MQSLSGMAAKTTAMAALQPGDDFCFGCAMIRDSAIEYRNRAWALRELATETVDEERRKLILELAAHYEQLALSEERIRQCL